MVPSIPSAPMYVSNHRSYLKVRQTPPPRRELIQECAINRCSRVTKKKMSIDLAHKKPRSTHASVYICYAIYPAVYLRHTITYILQFVHMISTFISSDPLTGRTDRLHMFIPDACAFVNMYILGGRR